MTSKAGCLTHEELELLAANALTPEEGARLRLHIDSCEACRCDFEERIENEAALRSFRRVSPSTGGSSGLGSASSTTGGAFASGRRYQDSIPGFEIEREIKRGGQGVVYEALQRSTRRKVAIKVMREGPFAGPSDRARFDREVHVLGRLKHPNIVTIHDSGEASGSFYFVMDYIDGRPLDVWTDACLEGLDSGDPIDKRLSAFLRIFVRICEAVHAAHLNGIIHRDLKPSNISIDAKCEPHVLDFGLAKIPADESDTDLDIQAMTMTGQFVGSLPWASPEQAQGLPGRIDVRTDVYSLGVILFQMLTGGFPYRVTGGIQEVLSNIVNVEPARPSTTKRMGARKSLRIDNELETIVLKALSKDRVERYQTAGEFGRDVQRYLSGEPIEAKGDSLGYVIRKQLRKHKLRAATAALFLVVIVVGFVVSLTLWRQAAHQRTVAQNERSAAEAARDRAVAETKKATAVTDFVQGMLQAVDPDYSGGNRDVTVRETLDAAAKELDKGSLKEQLEVEAAVRRVLGMTYRGLARYEESERQFRRVLEIYRQFHLEPHSNVEDALNNLAMVMQDQERYADAEALLREALAMCRKIYAPDHEFLLNTVNNLALLLATTNHAGESRRLYEEAVTARSASGRAGDAAYAQILTNYASLECNFGDHAKGVLLMRKALEIRLAVLPRVHPDVTESLNNLAFALYEEKRYAEAEPLFKQSIEIDTQLFGEVHPKVAVDLNNYALLVEALGRLDEAESLNRRALAIRRKALPVGHEELLTSFSNLAILLIDRKRGDEAEALLKEYLNTPNLEKRQSGSTIADIRMYLCRAMMLQKKYEEVERELLSLHEEVLKPAYGQDERRVVVQSLVALYKETRQQGKVDRWKRELAAFATTKPT